MPKGIINVIISGKNVYDQPIDFGIKRYNKIKKLATGKGEDYIKGCLLDHVFVRNPIKDGELGWGNGSTHK